MSRPDDGGAPEGGDPPGDGKPPLAPTLPPERPAVSELPPTFVGEPRADAPVPRPGQDFPVSHWERYALVELLGRGGMGEVYLAQDRRLGRSVALKFIRGADPDRVMRFLQEARAQARIDHPNVCKVFEVGEVSGKAYIAMQLVGGQRLDQAAATMTLPEKMEAMREVAAAIHEAHRLGIIHRDLKPSNIMLERREDGRCVPVVMDFGLAYEAQSGHGLTETGALLGTPAYMAPEQARGDVRSIDRRSDVYSLGATLYELITGEAPFSDATPVGTLAKVLNEEPRPFRGRVPHVSTDLETIVLKCLSKEPDQRYPSARALAEDLARCIDGEPILGRPPSLTYRLRRRARKHRTLVAVSAASLASILVLATFGVRSWLEARHTRQQSAERVRLAEQLGQQVKEIEWFLRTSNALPLHDTTREQQLVRERMARIAAQRHDLGANGEGLVHYALGRGHLAMHEFEQAHAELGLAREKGVDSRELHYALGRALGELYHQALKDARRGGDKAWVARRQRALEKQYLEPARQSLERSRGLELESPLYLEGLIAFFRGEYDAAARIAEQVAAQDPWMYEARKLAGDAAYARAMEQLERGEYDQARAGLRTAALLFDRAAESARSDAWCYEALAEAWLQQAEVDKRQGKSRKESLESALAASDKGLQAAPLRSSGHTKKAYVLMNWYRLMRFEGGGQDPKPILDAWTATAARAVELDPKDVHAHDTLGYSYFMRGYQDARDGRDPMPAWDEASSWLTRAIQLDPHYAWGLNELGLLNRWRGNYLREHGQDPRPAYAEAVRYFSESAKSDPTYLLARSNLVDVYGAMANYDLSRGLDPGPAVLKAREAGEQALAIDNNFYSALNHVALAELTRARYLVDTGADPRPSLERALQHLDSSLKINPKATRTWFHRATGHLLEAHLAMREDRDPGAAVAAGQRALAEASRNDAGCADCRILSARLALAEAEWARRQGQVALPQLRRALAEGRRAVELYPYYESHQELARACWKLAQVLPSGEAVATVTEGLTHVERALKLDANLAQAHAIRGGLLLQRARAVRAAAARLDTAQQARTAFARALELNPLLRRELEDVVRESESGTASPSQGR